MSESEYTSHPNTWLRGDICNSRPSGLPNVHDAKRRRFAWNSLLAGLLTVSVLVLSFVAPTELTMGHTQRLLYVHVPMAWLALLALPIMAGTGIAYLLCRRLHWDHWAQAAGELGWLCCSLTLLTGSLWAKQAWGTWWEWEPRLTSAFVLWVVYSGILLIRFDTIDRHRRARVGAVLATLGTLDVPLVILATRWFRGIHPVAPQMDTTMRIVLLLCVLACSLLFLLLLIRRQGILKQQLLSEDWLQTQ